MRVDDDVYIRGDKLTNFLSKLNSSETLFIGEFNRICTKVTEIH